MRGSGLPSVLFFAVLVMIIIASIFGYGMMISRYEYKLISELEIQVALQRLARELLRNESVLIDEELRTDESKLAINIKRRPHGAYLMNELFSFNENDTLRLNFLSSFSGQEAISLQVNELDLDLKWDGDVKVKGDICMPGKHCKRAFISSASQGAFSHGGGMVDLSEGMYILGDEFTDYYTEILLGKSGKVKEIVRITEGDSIKGMEIVVGRNIIIEKGSFVEDVMFVANRIHIKAGFEGALHAVSLGEILIEKNCTLSFPSSIVSIGNSGNVLVTMKEGFKMGGYVVGLKHDNRDQIKIDEGFNISGGIVTDGILDIKSGEIEGMVYSNQLFTRLPSGTYRDLLFNVKISGYIKSSGCNGDAIFPSILKGYNKRHGRVLKYIL